MKRVCVTGADGFIGRYLVEKLLEENIEVWGIGVNDIDVIDDRLHYYKLKFEEYNKLEKILPQNLDCFYHFAWSGVFGDAFKDYELQLGNCKYSCDAILISSKIKCKKFVLASTVNVLETRKYLTLNQITPRYTNIYASAKLSAEMMCKTLAYQNNIEFNCGLIAMVYGERNKSNMIPNVVIRNLINNQPSNLVSYDTPYDLIYVKDVARAFLYIGEKGVNQKTYYVGNEKKSTFGKIFDEVRNIINPNGVINYGVYPSSTDIDYTLIRLDELKIDTGFVPKYKFNETIISTMKWLKKEGE